MAESWLPRWLQERASRDSLGNAERLARQSVGQFDPAQPPPSTQPPTMFQQFVGEAAAPAGNMAAFLTGKAPSGRWVAPSATRKALDRAQEIMADPMVKLDPELLLISGGDPEKVKFLAMREAQRAGGPAGGWANIPVDVGPNGPVKDWVYHRPTLQDRKPLLRPEIIDPSVKWPGPLPPDAFIAEEAGKLLHLHPQMLKEHPDLAGIRMELGGDPPQKGGYYPQGLQGSGGEVIQAQAPNERQLREIIGHELGGHAIQNRKRWGMGSSPEIQKAVSPVPLTDKEALNEYYRVIGERNAFFNSDMDLNKVVGKTEAGRPVKARDIPLAWRYEKIMDKLLPSPVAPTMAQRLQEKP